MPGSERYSGNPTVADRRGACGNVDVARAAVLSRPINSTLGVRCGKATNRAEATLTMYPQSQDWRSNREGTAYLPASGGDGARVDGMVNVSEPLINVVSESKPKIAERLGPKRHRSGTWDSAFPRHGQSTLPADRG